MYENIKNEIIKQFNSLGISDMGVITDMHEGSGAFVNIEYVLPSGQTIKLWDDNKTYLINQVCKCNSNRCYGLVADEKYLLVCGYGDEGVDGEIIVFKQWN